MTDNIKNNAIRVYEIMKEKSYQPEEIEAFLEFLDKNTKEMTREITRPLAQRMDQLETKFKYGFWTLVVLILVAPGLAQDIIKIFLD